MSVCLCVCVCEREREREREREHWIYERAQNHEARHAFSNQ